MTASLLCLKKEICNRHFWAESGNVFNEEYIQYVRTHFDPSASPFVIFCLFPEVQESPVIFGGIFGV